MLANQILVPITLIFTILASYVYLQAAPHWYRNEMSRFLVGQTIVIGVLYVQALLAIEFHILFPAWVGTVVSGIVCALMLWHFVTFYRVTKAKRIQRRVMKRQEIGSDRTHSSNGPAR